MNTVRFTVPFAELTKEDRISIYGSSRIALSQRKDGEPARAYLQFKRGLDVDTIAKFRFGYIPFSVRHPLSGRLVMPLFDMYGKLLALSFRPIFDILRLKDETLVTAVDLRLSGTIYKFYDEANKYQQINAEEVREVLEPKPKYWNESFAKSEHLYGMDMAKYHIVKLGFAIVVEGQIDVASLHSHGFMNAVGAMGGAFSPIHALLLNRWTDQVIFIFDGDSSGRKFAEKAKETIEVFGLELTKMERDADDRIKTDRKTGLPMSKKIPSNFFKAASYTLPSDIDPDKYLRNTGSGIFMKTIKELMFETGMKLPKTWSPPQTVKAN